MKAPPDLILVADGNHARMIAHESKGDSVLWTMHCREPSRPPTKAFDGHGEPPNQQRTGPQRAAQLAFAREVADKVEETLAAASFRKFVVVAPPRTVGDLRREFCDTVLEAVTGEVEKDLVSLADSDVVAQLSRSSMVH
jgi:protein required for attachment to host cells